MNQSDIDSSSEAQNQQIRRNSSFDSDQSYEYLQAQKEKIKQNPRTARRCLIDLNEGDDISNSSASDDDDLILENDNFKTISPENTQFKFQNTNYSLNQERLVYELKQFLNNSKSDNNSSPQINKKKLSIELPRRPEQVTPIQTIFDKIRSRRQTLTFSKAESTINKRQVPVFKLESGQLAEIRESSCSESELAQSEKQLSKRRSSSNIQMGKKDSEFPIISKFKSQMNIESQKKKSISRSRVGPAPIIENQELIMKSPEIKVNKNQEQEIKFRKSLIKTGVQLYDDENYRKAIFNSILSENLIDQNDDDEPKYILWKKILARITNRIKSSEEGKLLNSQNFKQAKDKNKDQLFKLKKYLVDRFRRRQHNRVFNKNLARLYGLVTLIDKKNKKDKKSEQQSKNNKRRKVSIINAQLDVDEIKNMPSYVMYPNSKFRLFWDILIIFFVIYSVITLPMEIGLSMEKKNWQSTFETIIDILFFVDICLNFITSYTNELNKLIIDPSAIVRRYLKGWFLIDVFATLPFDAIASIYDIDAGSNIKLFSLLKCPRLLRLSKILKFLENMKGANLWRIAKLFVLFFLTSHWVGCIWFLIADPPEYPYSFGGKYVFAVYHGLLILVGENIQPDGNSSKLFVVFFMMIGQAISARIFGSMASMLKNFDQGQDIYTNKMDMINEHLWYHQIPNQVQEDIRQYYDYIWQRHRELIYGKKHFVHIAQNLEEKIQAHRYADIISKLEIFSYASEGLIASILLSIKPLIATPGEVLFYEGEVSVGLYILEKGTIELFNKQTKKLYTKLQGVACFGLESMMMKTGRHWCSALTRTYADLHIIPREDFERVLAVNFHYFLNIDTQYKDYPIDHDQFRTLAKKQIDKFYVQESQRSENQDINKVLNNKKIFKMISQHSSKSVGRNYELMFTKENIWERMFWFSHFKKLHNKLKLLMLRPTTTKKTQQRVISFEDEVELMKISDLKQKRRGHIQLNQDEINFLRETTNQVQNEEEQIRLFRKCVGKLINSGVSIQSKILENKIDQIFQLFEERVDKLNNIFNNIKSNLLENK